MGTDEVAHAIHRNTERHTSKLEEIRVLLEAATTQLAVGGSPNDRRLDDWPVPGASRWSVSHRRITGSDGVALQTGIANAVQIAREQPGRIGGFVANLNTTAANLVLLYLADSNAIIVGATPTIALTSAAGGFPMWNLEWGEGIWCGPISAVALAGTPSIAYAIG